MRARRWILLGAAVFLTAFFLWVRVSLRNDDSALAVVARYVKKATCWPEDSSEVCALKRMAKYEKNGRYDDAVSAGVALAQKYPDSFTSGWIYEDISELYLRRAKVDSGLAEEYLKQAAFYRDKALPSHLDSDSPYSLNALVAISESIGDLSTSQRCVQYRNSIKLLDRMKVLANVDQLRLARQFKPDVEERQKLDSLLVCIGEVTKRVGGKLSASGCQEQQHRSP